MRAEVVDRDVLVGHQVPRRLREQHLTAMPGRHDARGAMNVDADVVTIDHPRLTGVQPHPHSHLAAVRPGVGRKRPLPIRCGQERLPGRAEHDEKSVPFHPDLAPVVRRERRAQQGAMAGQQVGVRIARPSQQPRRPLDVREQKGHRAARDRLHAFTLRRRTAKDNPDPGGRARRLTRAGADVALDLSCNRLRAQPGGSRDP
jgi:hypothetical protein